MESSRRPHPTDAAAALHDAEAARTALANAIVPRRSLLWSLAFAITVQIATTAVGLGAGRPWVLAGGLVVFAAVAGASLVGLRRASGVWVAGVASRVVLGTDLRVSAAYTVALGAAIWAGFASAWWLVAVCSVAGGLAYAGAGRRWLARYRADPQDHVTAESAIELLALVALAAGGLVALVLNH